MVTESDAGLRGATASRYRIVMGSCESILDVQGQRHVCFGGRIGCRNGFEAVDRSGFGGGVMFGFVKGDGVVVGKTVGAAEWAGLGLWLLGRTTRGRRRRGCVAGQVLSAGSAVGIWVVAAGYKSDMGEEC